MQFINFLVVFVAFNVSLTVGDRDTDFRWGGGAAEECEKLLKRRLRCRASRRRLDLALPPNLAWTN